MSSFITTPRRPLSEADFTSWVGRATPGNSLEYHRGFLAIDIADGRLAAAEQKTLRQLARRAAWASDAGLVHLLQRRNGSENFSYLAIRRARPRSARRRKAERPLPEPTLEWAA